MFLYVNIKQKREVLTMIHRTKYLEKILPFINQPLIKVIIGVRRSGKTVLLSQIRERIVQSGVSENQIVNLNFESFANRRLLDADRKLRIGKR